MTVENDFLAVATQGTPNVQSQVDYKDSTVQEQGWAIGAVPPANVWNKMLRQATVIASQLAQAVCDITGLTMLDNADLPTTRANLKSLLQLAFPGLNYYVDSGVTNAYVITPSPAITAREPGMKWRVKIGAGQTNSGASTLNDGLGAVAWKRQSGAGTPLLPNDLIAGEIRTAVWNGTFYYLEEVVGSGEAGLPPIASVNLPAGSSATDILSPLHGVLALITGDDNGGNAWADSIVFIQYGNPVVIGSSVSGVVPVRTYTGGSSGELKIALSNVGTNWFVKSAALSDGFAT